MFGDAIDGIPFFLVARGRIELPTRGFSVRLVRWNVPFQNNHLDPKSPYKSLI